MRFFAITALVAMGCLPLLGQASALSDKIPAISAGACGCGSDEPAMDADSSFRGYTWDYWASDLDPRFNDFRSALEVKVEWNYLVASSLERRTFPLSYESDELGTFVKTFRLKVEQLQPITLASTFN
jgi:hypothetical protein